MYVYLFMTEKIETTTFDVLPNGVLMTMPVSKKFQQRGEKGGFAYVCLPWINRNEWHAFSLFENPADPSQRQVYMQVEGDWTSAVRRALQRKTARPVWIQGPFHSPYQEAGSYDNQILVATGIGITPALSVIQAHKDSRNINLIWAVRDQAMLEFYLEHLYLDHDGWNLIFYTGSKPLGPSILNMNENIRILEGRPNIPDIIANIIYYLEGGLGNSASDASSMMSRCDKLLEYNEKLIDLINIAKKEGLSAEKSAMAYSRLASLRAISGMLSSTIEPWVRNEKAIEFVKTLDKQRVLSTWGILYCGGSSPVKKLLKKFSEDFSIDLNLESFNW